LKNLVVSGRIDATVSLDVIGLVVAGFGIVLTIVLFVLGPVWGPKIARLSTSRSKQAIEKRLLQLEAELSLKEDLVGLFVQIHKELLFLAADILCLFGFLAGAMIQLSVIVIDIAFALKPSPWTVIVCLLSFANICISSLISLLKLKRRLRSRSHIQKELEVLRDQHQRFDNIDK
jgi:hypothetical protein